MPEQACDVSETGTIFKAETGKLYIFTSNSVPVMT